MVHCTISTGTTTLPVRWIYVLAAINLFELWQEKVHRPQQQWLKRFIIRKKKETELHPIPALHRHIPAFKTYLRGLKRRYTDKHKKICCLSVVSCHYDKKRVFFFK
jgi:hypothetical protein